MGNMPQMMSQVDNRDVEMPSLKDNEISGTEKRRRLHWQEAEMNVREIVGTWIDQRPLLGEKVILYREMERWFLETWFEDGCHSLDEMSVTTTTQGQKLEDKGGNFFGEYFILTPSLQLLFCNSMGAYYTADLVEQVG